MECARLLLVCARLLPADVAVGKGAVLSQLRSALHCAALWLLVVAFAGGSWSLPAHAQDQLSELLQQLRAAGSIDIAGAQMQDLPVLHQFYEHVGNRPAWTNPAAVEQLRGAIAQSFLEGMRPEDYHQRQIEDLQHGRLTPAERDLLLTDGLLRLSYHYAFGKAELREFPDSWNFKRSLPDVDPAQWAATAVTTANITTGLHRLKPGGEAYQRLIRALAQYRELAAAGGWDAVDVGPTLREGERGPRIPPLRRRLAAEGIAADETGDSTLFDPSLADAVAEFQRRHHLDADGIVGRETLAALNVSVGQRIDQLRVNLERARILQDTPATAVVVDIAGFEVTFRRDGELLLRSRAQVGKPYRSTPVFQDELRYIEFNPTWTVPPTILQQDVLPAIARDPDYLRRRHMQVLNGDGRVIDPAGVDWRAYPGRPFPYRIRQQPGPDNALGRLKIMFPNEHLVYLHDTPSRALFQRSARAFSSGCIRVEQAIDLAELLLDDPQRWNRSAIERVIASGETTRVNLPSRVPVYLAYWTAHVTNTGVVHFKRDPYDRDRKVLAVIDRPLTIDPGRLEAYPRGL